MHCGNCSSVSQGGFCADCITKHIRDFRLQTRHFGTDRDIQVEKAKVSLQGLQPARVLKANVSSSQAQVERIQAGLAALRKDNDSKRDKLRAMRESLATRRRTLAAAKLLPKLVLERTIYQETHSLTALSVSIARARSGLVQELVEVFNIVESRALGGKTGTQGQWRINDLVLPVPGDIRRYPPGHINAVMTHTVHFLGLLTFYLGVKLPFEITWSGKRLGVGQPWIGATSGTESGSWAKWYTKQPLHLSSAPTSTANPETSTAPTARLVSESYVEDSSESQASFTTAFAMLLYDVCYLAHTQSVMVPLAQAGELLCNLWALCCSPELGRRSHQTGPHLPPPTPPSFPLDFTQLLQATTANPSSRGKSKYTHASSRKEEKARQEKIVEEEDGWDLVEEY